MVATCVSVVTMIAADHLEWHGGLAGYTEAKANIVRFQRPDDVAVLNEENPQAMALARIAGGRVIAFGLEGRRPFTISALLP